MNRSKCTATESYQCECCSVGKLHY